MDTNDGVYDEDGEYDGLPALTCTRCDRTVTSGVGADDVWREAQGCVCGAIPFPSPSSSS